MSAKKWTVKRMTVGFTKQEIEILGRYCEKSGRTATDVIRECVRDLDKKV